MTQMRLGKALALSGVASRRAAEELIQSGEVTVNGNIVLVPQTLVDPDKDKIVYEGRRVEKEPKVYYLVHKPKGYVCTNAKIGKTKRAIDLVDANFRTYTVGRLDKDTSGLIIITNDGEFANLLMHPSSEVVKEYVVKVDKEVQHEHLVAISQGCFVEGKKVIPHSVKKVRRGTIKVAVLDGRKHEVRILCEHADLEVLDLKRIRIGQLLLGNLPVGAFRHLSPREIEMLRQVRASKTAPKP